MALYSTHLGMTCQLYIRCAAARLLLTATKANHLHKRTIDPSTAQEANSDLSHDVMRIATVRPLAVVEVGHGPSTKLTRCFSRFPRPINRPPTLAIYCIRIRHVSRRRRFRLGRLMSFTQMLLSNSAQRLCWSRLIPSLSFAGEGLPEKAASWSSM